MQAVEACAKRVVPRYWGSRVVRADLANLTTTGALFEKQPGYLTQDVLGLRSFPGNVHKIQTPSTTAALFPKKCQMKPLTRKLHRALEM